MSSYLYQQETHPATGVTHALEAHFLSATQISLVVVVGTHLKVYSLRPPREQNGKEKLQLEGSFRLFGQVKSIAAGRLAKAQRDCLFLTFMDAKLSVVEFDLETHDLKTVSMHAFEDPALRGGRLKVYHPCLVRVHPQNRCVAMTAYGNKLIVLPLQRDAALEAADQSVEFSRLQSHVVHCERLQPAVRRIIDMAWLEDYYSPTLMLLHEATPAWVGRYAACKDTMALVVLSIGSDGKTPVIWTHSDLPCDLHTLLAVPSPLGGALLIGVNCVVYVNQSSSNHGTAVNCHSRATTRFELTDQEGVALALDNSNSTFVDNDKLIMCLKTGQIYLVQLISEGRTLRRFRFERLASSVLTSSVCCVGPHHILLGSYVGNSLLLKKTAQSVARAAEANLRPPAAAAAAASAVEVTSQEAGDTGTRKRRRVSAAVEDNLDFDLYADASSSRLATERQLTTYSLSVCDSILNIGPIGCATVGHLHGRPGGEFEASVPPLEIIASSGSGKNGALSILRRGIRPLDVLSTDALKGCFDLWSVRGSPAAQERLARRLEQEAEAADKAAAAAAKAEAERGAAEATATPVAEGTEGAAAAAGAPAATETPATTAEEAPAATEAPLDASLDEEGDGDASAIGSAGYLILSQKASSRVLSTDSGLAEMDKTSGFFTDGVTIYAGNLFQDRFIVQVTTSGVQLLEGERQISHFSTPQHVEIVSCSSVDRYVGLLLSDATFQLLTVNTADNSLVLEPCAAITEGSKKDPIMAVSLFDDSDGIFKIYRHDANATDATTDDKGPGKTVAPPLLAEQQLTAEEEDDMLYGDLDDDDDSMAAARPGPTIKVEGASSDMDGVEAMAAAASAAAGVGVEQPSPHWCAVYRKSGALQLYHRTQSSTEHVSRFYIPNFHMTPGLLVDSGQDVNLLLSQQAERPEAAAAKGATADAAGGRKADDAADIPLVREILLTVLGEGTKPYLFAYTDAGHIAVYEAFGYDHALDLSAKWDGRLNMRFKKFEHNTLFHKPLSYGAKDSDLVTKKKSKKRRVVDRRRRKLFPFEDVGGFDGVFVAGEHSAWFLMGPRRVLRCHPMTCDGPVACFTGFDNASCERGFIYFTTEGVMTIAKLLPNFAYDADWLTRKIQLGVTPTHVDYHYETQTVPLVTRESFDAVLPARTSNEEPSFDPVPVERDLRFVHPLEDKFRLRLMSPRHWEEVPDTMIEFQPYEHVTCCSVVSLHSDEHVSLFRGYVAVGITTVMGEEVTARGKIHIYDILDVVPEPGKPLTKNKFKELVNSAQKGAVTALGAVQGYLIGCIGQRDGAKLYVWHFKNKEIIKGIGFCEAQMYAHQIRSIKNFVLVADAFQSVQLHYFREMKKRSKTGGTKIVSALIRIGRDAVAAPILGCDFVVQDNVLLFMCMAENGNVSIYSYSPDDPDSEGGRMLTRRADYNTGLQAHSIMRLRCAPTVVRPGTLAQPSRRHFNCYASYQGALGFFLPIPEVTYRRLHMLQMRLTTGLQHRAGLNPKAYHMFAISRQYLGDPRRNVLQGGLLHEYLLLSVREQREYARQCGTTHEQVLDDLLAIQRATTHF